MRSDQKLAADLRPGDRIVWFGAPATVLNRLRRDGLIETDVRSADNEGDDYTTLTWDPEHYVYLWED